MADCAEFCGIFGIWGASGFQSKGIFQARLQESEMVSEICVSCMPFLEFAFPLTDRFKGSDWLAETKSSDQRAEKKH